MLLVTIAADGGCTANGKEDSIAGWGAIIICQGFELELSGGFYPGTNNQAELIAVISAIEFLSEPTDITVVSDSQYVCKGYNEWVKGWIRNGWINSANKPVKNRELWERLLAAIGNGGHRVGKDNFKWVKGHAGHELNERVDQLATAEIKKIKNRLTKD